MGFLSIKKVEYIGDKYYFESPTFDDGVSIIEGPNGTGKSTFFNLIYYGLGGRVEEFDPTSTEVHVEIVNDSNNFVRLVIGIDNELFTISRRLRDNNISVIRAMTEADGVPAELQANTYPIVRREDAKTFSDWLLEKLHIPVVDIFQGGKQFKLNFTDLARLIYHNQSPDPNGIYKPADATNFVSDSLEIRRAIFQILIGKTLMELYAAIGSQKNAERDFMAAKSVRQEYEDIVNHLLRASGINEISNIKALNERIEDLEAQIESLLASRKAFSRGQLGSAQAQRTLDAELRQVHELMIQQRTIDENREQLIDEAGRLVDVERALGADIQRINKVIYAHGQLNLFSRDTCPYCLNDVLRTPGHCVCGHAVEEQDYQRFFYSPAEYLEILKGKTKALETLKLAIRGIREEHTYWNEARERVLHDISTKRARIEKAGASPYQVEKAMEELDDKLLELREKLAKCQEAFRLESKLGDLLKRQNDKKALFERLKLEVQRLDSESKVELQKQINAFDRTYHEFMTTVVVDCRSAAIDRQTYLPIINNGQYREHSAKVPKRFLYYLDLLQLALLSDIPFPRLLLVDTPETAGIDLDGLVKMLRQIDALENPKSKAFQILFSTGNGKYPPEFASKVVLRLSKEQRLLVRRDL
ncbi:MAG: AAA family ATPase [Gammaproteobacteria bacterium]|nr:AAA family ATPase [Gammaproteobacteria bacterium]MBU0849297.1 AAA family ATPase [Gammaproteobacteria bacterium]MBU1781634.1 AAA family ATPase [Gammaproteobacteria bacterium]MBU2088919.1 AAA family ATPase [Gammaproteobacteria bacterium]MBU2128003.1 AAA family ATPase [Gammaproteobacteria bacterium]